jgi:predicted metalloprotease
MWIAARRTGKFSPQNQQKCADRLQRQTQGYVVPDASAQRTRWFLAGLKSGQVSSCDSFRAEQI